MFASRAHKTTDGADAPPSGWTNPELVQFLLIRYARDETLAYVYENLCTYMPAPRQDESEKEQKLWKVAHCLGGIVAENSIPMQYDRGRLPALRKFFRVY